MVGAFFVVNKTLIYKETYLVYYTVGIFCLCPKLFLQADFNVFGDKIKSICRRTRQLCIVRGHTVNTDKFLLLQHNQPFPGVSTPDDDNTNAQILTIQVNTVNKFNASRKLLLCLILIFSV